MDDYPSEDFEEAFFIKYARLEAARLAKLRLDDYNFYGAQIIVKYAPQVIISSLQ